MHPSMIDSLKATLVAVDPSIRFVSPRWMRRIIKLARAEQGLGGRIVHDFCYCAPRRIVESFLPQQKFPSDSAALSETETVLLLPDIDEDRLEVMPPSAVLTEYWKWLFHAEIDRQIDQQIATGRLGEAELQQRIVALGVSTFHEADVVLHAEKRLFAGATPLEVWREFVATFLELHRFAPQRLPIWFPSIASVDQLLSLLERDLDIEAIAAKTRPTGADDHEFVHPPVEDYEKEVTDTDDESTDKPTLLRQAEQEHALGNVVRAAILRCRAGVHANKQLDALVERLRPALHLDAETARSWRKAVQALTPALPRGIRSHAARLLLDLQKICTDHERDIYTADLVEWAWSLGRRPIRRKLEMPKVVRPLLQLRSALKHLEKVKLSDRDHQRLFHLLEVALHQADERMRQTIRPVLVRMLDEVGLLPQSHVEAVSREKLVEELLDRIRERGFLQMSDLRDAVARNQLKLSDLAGPMTFLRGDAILQANAKLAIELDGVYHRGEIYLRWLQRFTSLLFGTRFGRVFCLYLAAPFGGAFMLLEFLQHMSHSFLKIFGLLASFLTLSRPIKIDEPSPLAEDSDIGDYALELIADTQDTATTLFTATAEPHIELVSLPSVLIFGCFLLGLLHSPLFRRWVGRGLRFIFQVLRFLLISGPRWLLQQPWMKPLLDNPVARFIGSYLLLPSLFALIAGVSFHLWRWDWPTTLRGAAIVFALTTLLLNNRWGREVQEWLVETVRYEGWKALGRFVLAVLDVIMTFFKRLVERVERLIYTVDEWLCFREGDSSILYRAKLCLGVVWFFITYIVRFGFNLLLEPQINPIKHFPTVTVSHKLLLPMIPGLAEVFGTSEATMALIVSGIPGIFGFLMWELKENWKLYRANRSPNLGRVMIGSHGESMPRLLRPGFHSGTIPNLFSKWRKADRHAAQTGDHQRLAKVLHDFEHLRESLQRFFDRELLNRLHRCEAWGGFRLRLGELRLTTNRIEVEIRSSDQDTSLRLRFEEQGAWLIVEIAQDGWLASLSEAQRDRCRGALLGLYKLAGVDLIREALNYPWGRQAIWYIHNSRLHVWPHPGTGEQILYDLYAEPLLVPSPFSSEGPTLCREAVLFCEVPLPWTAWQAYWETNGSETTLLPAVEVLPKTVS